jgi:hypothetical protein
VKGQYIRILNSWKEETKALTDAEKGRLVDALIEYQITGKDQQPEGNEKLIYPVMAERIRRENATSERHKGEKKGARNE